MKNSLFALLLAAFAPLLADNQTPTLSPVFNQIYLPFTVDLETADFTLPNGIHSYASAVYDNKLLLLAGRTNGMHGFSTDNNNFPVQEQNGVAYVVDIENKQVWSRALNDASGLSQTQIDLLSVTSPQSYQSDKKLYITGGYGVDSSTGQFSTKESLTAISIPGFMKWIMKSEDDLEAVDYIQTIFDDIFQVTGGYMTQIENGPTLLVFGQNFTGYYSDSANGDYTQQVRRFHINDSDKKLEIELKTPKPEIPDPNYRRRDLNVVPILSYRNGHTKQGLVAYSGVFTQTDGVWTVPVEISASGSSVMADPSDPFTFKQAMNQYTTAAIGMYSHSSRDMYTLLCGGISYGFFESGEFTTDSEIPFINQTTTIKRDEMGTHTQYLMDASYPTIASTFSNVGNTLLFGAGATFFPKQGIELYSNGVLQFDKLKKKRQLIGYIVGGIQSSVPNTEAITDSAAAPYIFKVYITLKK